MGPSEAPASPSDGLAVEAADITGISRRSFRKSATMAPLRLGSCITAFCTVSTDTGATGPDDLSPGSSCADLPPVKASTLTNTFGNAYGSAAVTMVPGDVALSGWTPLCGNVAVCGVDKSEIPVAFAKLCRVETEPCDCSGEIWRL